MQVYQLHEKGTRLDRTKVMRRIASLGDLIIRERPDMPGRGLLIAQLLNPDLNYVIPLLDQATVTRITPRGILIEGTELIPPRGAKGFYTRYQQAWWCEPVTEVPRQSRHLKSLLGVGDRSMQPCLPTILLQRNNRALVLGIRWQLWMRFMHAPEQFMPVAIHGQHGVAGVHFTSSGIHPVIP